ncbi:MAG TPA: DMT family transporter [Polyangiaceae bacterium]|jgi:drug/metabolite transporter (DMT)-like permease
MTREQRRSRAVGVALVLMAAVLWSTGGIGIKSVAGAPLSIAGWRGLFALPVLAGMVVVRARRVGAASLAVPLRSPWAWVGAASYAVMVICFVVATRLTTAANAIFIQYTSPVYVALLSWPLLRERVTWINALACAGVLAGMVLFFREGLSADARAGNLVAVVSSFGAAGLPLALRADQRSLTGAAGGHGLAAAAVAPAIAIALGDVVAVVVCAPAMLAAPPDAHSLVLLAALGLGQIGLPYALYALAVPHLTALEGSLVPTLEPILNPVWVALGTGERPGPMAIVGGGFVLASVLLQALAGRARTTQDLTEA